MERPDNFVELSGMMKVSVSEEETGLFIVNASFSHLRAELPHAFSSALLDSTCIAGMGGRDRSPVKQYQYYCI